MPHEQRHRPQRVTVVAHQEATTSSLETYLDSMGVTTFSSNQLVTDALPAMDLIVLFPDGFQEDAIDWFLGELRRLRPKLPIVVVTSRTQAYALQSSHAMTVVLPRPTFAWGILDVLRLLHTESERKARR